MATDRGGPIRTVAPSTGSYPELDGVRGIASLAVVATHVAYWTGNYGPTGWGLLWARLDIGVALFFVISGFLLYRKWLAALANGTAAPSTKRYLAARFWRIVPAYWLVVVVAFLLVPSGVGTGFAGLVEHLSLTQIYGGRGQHQGLTQMWSLCVEVSFYLLLPVLAWWGARLAGGQWRARRLAIVPLTLGAVTGLWLVVSRLWVAFPLWTIYGIQNYLPWFAAGMILSILAVGAERGEPAQMVQVVRATPLSLVAIGIALAVIVATPAGGPATTLSIELFAATVKIVLYAMVGLLLLAPLVLRQGSDPVSRFLVSRPMAWLGNISYELFLVHLIVLTSVMRVLGWEEFTGDPVTVGLLTISVSLLAAWGLSVLVTRVDQRRRRSTRTRRTVDHGNSGQGQDLDGGSPLGVVEIPPRP